MNSKFDFLKSTRFWKLVTIGLLEALLAIGVIDTETSAGLIRVIEMVLGGSIVIKTVDRFAEKSGAVDTGAVIATPTPSSVAVPPKNEQL